MDLDFCISRLESGARAIEALARGVGDEQARWKPSPGKWSIVEVVCHLHDEEREDFRTRLDHTLHRPGEPWPPIDPEGWVTSRHYAARMLEPSLDAFLDERWRSLEWLRELDAPDWSRAAEHPRAGRLTAGDLLASWAAHDLLHVRQLARLHYQYVEEGARPHRVEYAGGW